jgi:hypothetical protein
VADAVIEARRTTSGCASCLGNRWFNRDKLRSLFKENTMSEVQTLIDLNGGWTDGSPRRAVISVVSTSSLTIDMSTHNRPAAMGSIIDGATIAVTFPDDATYIGNLHAPNTIRWSNGSTWTKVTSDTLIDLNGRWTDGSPRHAVIFVTSTSNLTIDMSAHNRPDATGSIIDGATIAVTFPEDATYIGNLHAPNTIRWSNGSTWTKV